MTFWQFLDRLAHRFDTRSVAGAGIFALTCIILWMIAEFPLLSDNDLFKVIAQAIVVQGLIGLAMASWFTRRGDEGPIEAEIVNTPDNPAQTHDVGDEK